MYDYRTVDHDLVSAVWSARSHGTSSYVEPANEKWNFVIERMGKAVTAAIIGPSYSTYEFPHDVEGRHETSFTYGVELHEYVCLRSMDKTSMRGRMTPLPVADAMVTIGDCQLSVTCGQDLVPLIEELHDLGEVYVDPDARGTILGQVATSTRTRQRVVKRATGLTPGQLQRIRRTRKAATALVQGEKAVSVAARLGFADQSHLTKSLKRYCRKNPSTHHCQRRDSNTS